MPPALLSARSPPARNRRYVAYDLKKFRKTITLRCERHGLKRGIHVTKPHETRPPTWAAKVRKLLTGSYPERPRLGPPGFAVLTARS